MTATLEGSRLSSLSALIPALIAGIVPLAVLPGAFGPFHAGKWFLVLTLVPAGLAICAATGTIRWPHWKWFLGWIVVCALSAVLGVAPWMSLAGSPNRNAGLLAALVGVGAYVLGASTGTDPRAQRMILRGAFLAGGVVGLGAIAEAAGLDLYGTGDVDGLTRARSTWGSATFAGSHLVLVLPLAIAHLRSRDVTWRVLAAVSTVTITIGLVLTGTRGAWLAGVAAAAVMIPTWRSTSASQPAGSERLRSRSATLAVAAAAVVAVVLAVAVIVPNLGRSSGVGRIDQWRTAVPVIADRPILGSGPDTQRVVLPSGIDEDFEIEHGSEELHDRVHNLVLDTLVTTGVVGLVALGAIGVVIFRRVAGKLRNKLIPTAIAAGLVAYLVSLMFAFGDPAIDPIAWLLTGLLVVGVGADDSTEDSADDRSKGVALATAALGVVALLLGGVWAGGEVLGEYRLDSALEARAAGDLTAAAQSLEGAASVAPARFDLDQIASRVGVESITAGSPVKPADEPSVEATASWASQRLDRAKRIAADDPDLAMDRAELFTAWQRPRQAIDVYDRVANSYPNSFRAQLGLGLAESQLGHPDRAGEAWVQAARLAPKDTRALVNLGLLHEAGGDPDEALKWFQKALKVDPTAPGAAAGVERVSGPEGG